ncbi:hypothetical protein AGDE_12130 [Angomonas deanei]|uniref:Uncharacterized protein n=1 Tax=Angomonas deanei TaxID=59799 RepID=A0A7G2C5P9_9TRYP|nr:hypothetical protein AGDE_12130 [Angomonas deanei]CAD2214815.1 hypothetical protein, conserved [Angomonas deanei]|eukprot:EPY24871.1 hypothetical protein AGDE_12130 [Angomonas deanei]
MECEVLTATLTQFLKANEEEQAQLVLQHPQLFNGPILEALQHAKAQLQNVRCEIREASKAIDAVASVVDLPGGVTKLQPGEKEVFENDDYLYDNFALTLSRIIAENMHLSKSNPATVAEPRREASHWYGTSSIVLEILSYLPAEELFAEVEYVCKDWMFWLSEAEVTPSFWLGVVQREYPDMLKSLLESEGPSMLFDSDWRSTAMLCVVNSQEGENDEEEEA